MARPTLLLSGRIELGQVSRFRGASRPRVGSAGKTGKGEKACLANQDRFGGAGTERRHRIVPLLVINVIPLPRLPQHNPNVDVTQYAWENVRMDYRIPMPSFRLVSTDLPKERG